MRTMFVNTILEQAQTDERIYVVTPDLGYSVLEPFEHKFPDRFLNVGIAEQNAIGIAAGLALSGKIVYVYSIIPFITARCYEQIKMDCAYMNANVRIVGVGAGFTYGAAGASHHATEDIAIMRSVPNMSVLAPGCPNEVRSLIKYSFKHNGPMYVRLAKKGEAVINTGNIVFGQLSAITNGSDCALIATSNMLEEAYKTVVALKKEDINIMLLSAHTLKPFDTEAIKKIIDMGIPIITLEEHSIIGGLASIVSDIIATYGKAVKFLPIAIPDKFSHYVGCRDFIRQKMGILDIRTIIKEYLLL